MGRARNSGQKVFKLKPQKYYELNEKNLNISTDILKKNTDTKTTISNLGVFALSECTQ